MDKGWFRMKPTIDAKPNMAVILSTAAEIADAMHFLHSKGVMHGDLTGGALLTVSSFMAAVYLLKLPSCPAYIYTTSRRQEEQSTSYVRYPPMGPGQKCCHAGCAFHSFKVAAAEITCPRAPGTVLGLHCSQRLKT